MNRFKDYRFWTALAGAVVILINALGECFGFSVDNDLVSGLIMAVAGILVVFGVVSKPKENQNEEENKSDEIDENVEDKSDEINESESQTNENNDQINQEELQEEQNFQDENR